MTDQYQVALQTLLEPSDLSRGNLDEILSRVMTHQVDEADLYFQAVYHEAWSLEDGLVKDGSYHYDKGVGIRAISGEQTGFAYSDDLSLKALQEAASAARSISGIQRPEPFRVRESVRVLPHTLYLPQNPLSSLSSEEKIRFLERIDKAARAHDPRISEVFVSLGGEYEVVLIVASDGTEVADIRPLVRLNVSVNAEHKGRRESGFMGGGGRVNYRYFLEDDLGIQYAHEACRQALVNLEAGPAPAGLMPVVLGAGWSGVLLHEAVGHGLEGDFNRKGTSAFSGRIGELVASPLCTVVDEGNIPDRRGSLNVDDEGTPTQCNVLIENGVLKGYMQDKLNARLMNMPRTGNGRRESYAHLPLPRMTNTFMRAGTHPPEEIIASVSKGLYVPGLGGGQVDITSGKFVFSASEAYLIENGKVTKPVKGAMLVGNGPEALKKVSMVGDDLKLDSGIGTCGKDGQSVPVGVGQPTIKLDELTVGGTEGVV